MASSRLRKRIRTTLFVFWLCVGVWLFWNMQAHGVGDDVLQSGDSVRVTRTDSTIVFTPTVDTASVGLLFYPGALVQPLAYASLARSIAEAGFEVVIVPLPFRLAPFAGHRAALSQRTLSLIQDDRRHRAWIVGGHSLGGKLAAVFARDHARGLGGLLLVGTSHPREDNLSGLDLDVTKVYGSEDGLASEEEVDQYAPNLPEATHFRRIDGGNHAQFGHYGYQLGDRSAGISRETQQARTLDAILEQLRRVARVRYVPL